MVPQALGVLSYSLHEQLAAELDGGKRYGYRRVKAYSVDIKSASKRRKTAARPARESTQPRAPPTRELPHQDHWLNLPAGTEAEQSIEQKMLRWLNHDHVQSLHELGEEDTTAQVHPRQFVHALWEECRKAAVQKIHGRAEAVTRHPTDGTVTSLRVKSSSTEPLDLPVDKLLLCAGPWTGKLANRLFSSSVSIPVHDLPGHSIIYRPHPSLLSSSALPEALFARISDDDTTTGPELFTRPDGTIYLAGENTGAPLPPGTADTSLDETSLRKLKKGLDLLLSPEVAKQGEIISTGLCYRPVTRKGTPYVGSVPGVGNTFVAAGHGPWGITLGPGTGYVMMEMLLGREKLSANVEGLRLPRS